MFGYDSPEAKREVWPGPIKPVRDTLVSHIRKADDLIYEVDNPARDKRYICDTAQMEYNAKEKEDVDEMVERSGLYRDGFKPTLLQPTQFHILHRNNKAYRVGFGSFGRIFLAQDRDTGELVAIKGFNVASPETVIQECGYFHQAQQMLDGDRFEKAYLRGFLKIRDDSEMSKNMKPLMCVISLAGLTKGAPIQLTLDVALRLAKELDISKKDWQDIMYSVVVAAKQFYDQGLHHGDYNGRNICIGYHDNRYKLTIIDFGSSMPLEKARDKEDDLYTALTQVLNVANKFNWTHTAQCASNVVNNRWGRPKVTVDWCQVLQDLDREMSKD